MTTQAKIKVLIERAIKGGYKPDHQAQFYKFSKDTQGYFTIQIADHFLLDPDFYKALDKARGERCFTCVRDKRWSTEECGNCGGTGLESNWKRIGLDFHEINLTQSFEAGIDYLYELTEKK